MKRLLIVAASLAIAMFAAPILVTQSEAASPNSPYCNLAKSQRNPVAWNSYYGCLGPAPRAAPAAAPVRESRNTSPYCNMAKTQRNPVSWNSYYGCLSR